MDIQAILELATNVIKALVANPDEVQTSVREDSDDKGKVYTINVRTNRSDVGVCIGNEGRTADAIRRVFGVIGWKRIDARVYVRINVPKMDGVDSDFPDD